MTKIDFNGSRWRGGPPPDSIEELIKLMNSHPLERHSGAWAHGNMSATITFHGNFIDISHAFSITSDEDAVCAGLFKAMRSNYQRFRTERARR